MHITAPKKTLVRALSSAVGVADAKSAMPILANVLLTAGDGLRLAASDIYRTIRVDVGGAEVLTAGSVALPAKDLLERVKAMPDGPVEIIVSDGSQATVKAVGKARKYVLSGLPGGDFPAMPDAPNSDALTVPAATLATLIKRVAFSMSTDETRAHVHAALLEWHSAGVRMVSTDGHRISKADASLDCGTAGTALVSFAAVNELGRLVETDGIKGGDIKIARADGVLFFIVPGVVFSVKLIDAQFPPWSQVIPKSWSRAATLDRATTIDTIRAVSLAAGDRAGGVKLVCAKDAIRVLSESPERGSGEDVIPCEWDSDSEIRVGDAAGFNAKYLLEALGAVEVDEVQFCMGGELDPMIVRPASPEGQAQYVNVSMPMRLS